MGEYARKNGESVKLGTCENLYYVTRADIMALQMAGWNGDGGNRDLCSYLEEAVCRVRLPQLHEPAGDVHVIESREMNTRPKYRINIDRAMFDALRAEGIEHTNMYHSAGGTNFFVPCPMSKEGCSLRTSGIHPHIFLSAEGLGNRRAVYECPYCAAEFNLNGHDLQPAIVEAFERVWCENTQGANADGTRTYLRELVRCGLPVAV